MQQPQDQRTIKKAQGLQQTPQHEVLRLPSVVRRVGLSASSIRRDVSAGLFPRPIRLGPRSRTVGWVEAEIDRYLAERIAERDLSGARK